MFHKIWLKIIIFLESLGLFYTYWQVFQIEITFFYKKKKIPFSCSFKFVYRVEFSYSWDRDVMHNLFGFESAKICMQKCSSPICMLKEQIIWPIAFKILYLFGMEIYIIIILLMFFTFNLQMYELKSCNSNNVYILKRQCSSS